MRLILRGTTSVHFGDLGPLVFVRFSHLAREYRLEI